MAEEKVKKGVPTIKDVQLLVRAGINPVTGLPIKFGKIGKQTNPKLKVDVNRYLRIIDEQRAVNRYTWYNLPAELSSQELERLLYYKGQIAFFYFKEIDQFVFMPYALDGTIDFYGRYNTIHPVPMTSGTTEDEKAQYKSQAEILSMKKLKVRKDLVLYADEITEELLENSAVILRDYINQLPQEQTPRYIVNDELISAMAECIPFMRTSMIISTGVMGMRVPDDDSYHDAEVAGQLMYEAAVNGNPYIPMTAKQEFQELCAKSALKAQEFMLAMQSLDNLLLAGYGIENGGLFEKKAHILNQEASINNAPVGLVYQDGLTLRQNFCNIVNSIWGLGIWCMPSEAAMSYDMNGDGMPVDNDPEGSQSGATGGGEK